jgi:DNA adenine methylase
MERMKAKPFLKWAGGKSQLIDTIDKMLPKEIAGNKFTYIEPFVGGGAVLFWVLNNYTNVGRIVINDINTDLMNSYQTIKDNVDELILILKEWEQEYHKISRDEEQKKEYYYQKRTLFNLRTSDQTTQTALLIFLNRTCFNGLYRVNRKNEFNVPVGSYKTPQICNEPNLRAVNVVLQKVIILNSDFSATLDFASENTFFYFDPPYKPLNETSSFNAYAKDEFGDNEQTRLKQFCDTLNVLGHKWMLSNSDVKGKDISNNFFDDLYSDYNISRVEARRIINANPNKRGKLTELLITN